MQFTRDSRVELAALLRVGKSQSECAQALGLHRSSVCRELTMNTGGDDVYRGGAAHRMYLNRKKKAKQKEYKIKGTLRAYVIRKLKAYWSPEQIAGRLKKEGIILCHETVYQFVYEKRPDLVKYLRRQKNKYRKKRGSRARIQAAKALKIKRIDERPEIVEKRERIGDWEGDTVVGQEKTQRILTYVERKSGFAMADKLNVVTAEIVQHKTIGCFKKLPKKARRTLTRDNGTEFGDYDRDLARAVHMEVYRAHPYHSWERGTNENWNGLARQFFPKGMFFAIITQSDVVRAVRLLNDRPRKRLGYATPREVFKSCCDSE
jgi:transposase, IS30 family